MLVLANPREKVAIVMSFHWSVSASLSFYNCFCQSRCFNQTFPFKHSNFDPKLWTLVHLLTHLPYLHSEQSIKSVLLAFIKLLIHVTVQAGMKLLTAVLGTQFKILLTEILWKIWRNDLKNIKALRSNMVCSGLLKTMIYF